MHCFTHPKPESIGQSGRWQSTYHDTMIDHDKQVGLLLDKLDELGIAEDTIVIYSTDNGPHQNTWPDAGTTPFRSEKNTNWEGAFRVPELIRWPGKIPAGVVSNEIVQHHDWLPTLLAAAGDTTAVEDLKSGRTIGGTTYRVHIDGFNLLPYLTGEVDTSPRKGFVYFSDDGDVLALRFDNWKVVFMEQRCPGTLQIWAEPFVSLRVPKVFNLRTDPFERADVTSNTYYQWLIENVYLILAATTVIAEFLATFPEFPPRQKAASFTIDQAMERMNAALTSGHESGADGARRDGVDPLGDLRHGLGRPLPGGGAAPRRRRRRLRDRPLPGRPIATSPPSSRPPGYVTVAERPLDPATSQERRRRTSCPDRWCSRCTAGPVDLRHLSQWWTWTPGASWRHPQGPGSSIDDRADHPVVHVAYEDAEAYAAWAGQGAADRGRVGVGGARRSRGCGVRVG